MNNGVSDWERIEGKLTKIKYQNKVWILEELVTKKDATIRVNRTSELMTRKKPGSIVKIRAWLIKNKSPGAVFTLDEYYRAVPNQRVCNSRITHKYFPRMVKAGEITQIDGKKIRWNGVKE